MEDGLVHLDRILSQTKVTAWKWFNNFFRWLKGPFVLLCFVSEEGAFPINSVKDSTCLKRMTSGSEFIIQNRGIHEVVSLARRNSKLRPQLCPE